MRVVHQQELLDVESRVKTCPADAPVASEREAEPAGKAMAVDGGNGRQGEGDDAAQELVVIVAEEGRVRREAVEVEAVAVDQVSK